MRTDDIPLIWDNGTIGSVAVDSRGILRLRHAIDHQMARDLEFAKGALRLPSAAPPYHASPSIDAAEVTALINELAWHRR